MELLLESRMTRKILLLQESKSEVLVLTSRSQIETWPTELAEALESCARRGLLVRVLAESGNLSTCARAGRLGEAGAELRQSRGMLSWLPGQRPVQGEIWVFDREEVVAVNERKAHSSLPVSLSVECRLGAEVAHGTAAYFDLRWGSGAAPVSFSVRHKSYALHSGQQSAAEFFACLMLAKEEISLSLPGSRLSKRVEAALHGALSHGVRVTIFLNAEREDAPALRRLRRLHEAGATLKICGRRLRSECAIVDGQAVFMGSLPSSWHPLPAVQAPAFLVQNRAICHDLLGALEGQVSVEISRAPATRGRYAFR